MQVGEQGGHLLVSKATIKGRHHSFAGEYHGLNLGIGCGGAAGEGRLGEETVEVGWDLLQAQVVVPVAVSTPDLVEVLALQLLVCELRFEMATCQSENHDQREVDERVGAG